MVDKTAGILGIERSTLDRKTGVTSWTRPPPFNHLPAQEGQAVPWFVGRGLAYRKNVK